MAFWWDHSNMTTKHATTTTYKEDTFHIPCNELFTPILSSNGERLTMRVEPKLIQRPFQGIITDKLTGNRYRISPRSCGYPCHCDAIAEPVGDEESGAVVEKERRN